MRQVLLSIPRPRGYPGPQSPELVLDGGAGFALAEPIGCPPPPIPLPSCTNGNHSPHREARLCCHAPSAGGSFSDPCGFFGGILVMPDIWSSRMLNRGQPRSSSSPFSFLFEKTSQVIPRAPVGSCPGKRIRLS